MTSRTRKIEPSCSTLTGVVDAALKGKPAGAGWFGDGYVVDRAGSSWFVKVPGRWREMGRKDKEDAAAYLKAEVETASGVRAKGMTRFIDPTWFVRSSSGVPALVGTAGRVVNMSDVDVELFGEVEEFLTLVEEAGWRVRDDIQLVRSNDGRVLLTDFGEWRRAASRREPSELDERLREAAAWSIGEGRFPLVTIGELRRHGSWLRRSIAAGSLPAGQREVERSQWLAPMEERLGLGLPVPEDIQGLVRSVADGSYVGRGASKPRSGSTRNR